jgi:dihydroxyacetone kinase
MLAQLLDTSDKDRNYLSISKSDKIVLLVNNLGGVSPLELGGITTEVHAQLLSEYGIEPVRVLSGTFMTSLNGLGFSISLLKLIDTNVGHSLLELLDAPSEAVGWSSVVSSKTWKSAKSRQDAEALGAGEDATEPKSQPSNIKGEWKLRSDSIILIHSVQYAKGRTALTSGLNRVIKAEPDITKYDTIVGDGDCGIGLKRGAEGRQKQAAA